LRIHLVYDHDYIEQLKDILGLAGHDIVEWDYSLLQFADFSYKKQTTAEVAVVDGQAGITKKKEIIESLKTVRKNIPHLRIMVILPSSMERDDDFISKLLTLSIYDMYFTDEYSIDELNHWLSHPKNFANYNININITGGVGEKTKLRLPEDEPSEKPGPLMRMLNKTLQTAADRFATTKKGNNPALEMLSKAFRATTEIISNIKQCKGSHDVPDPGGVIIIPPEPVEIIEPARIIPPAEPPQPVVIQEPPVGIPRPVGEPSPVDTKQSPAGGFNNIYGYKVSGYDDVINFDDWSSLAQAAALVPPDIILFAPVPGIKDKIDSAKCITAVIGEATEETVNADYHFSTWSDQAKAKASSSQEQLDPLTGLPGRHTLERESSNLIRQADVFCLVICDLDFFKTINDTYGHQAGDDVLKEYAGFLRQNVRKSDTVIRYGGEEFVLLFPGADKPTILATMQKIRQAWKDRNIYGITFSAGIASYPDDGQTLEEILGCADKALYRAKNSGRDKVCSANEPSARIVRLVRPAQTALHVWVVCGTAPRVGTTTFAAALFETARKRNDAILVDAGGGASRYRQSSIAPPYAFPGAISIVDAGTRLPEELTSLATYFFIVTDLCGDFNIRKHLKLPGITCLVGNRGATPGRVKSVADSWRTRYICLPSVPRLTDKYNQIYLPRGWRQVIRQAIRLAKEVKN
jgi:diguanylate cyclase (GGDEF)-like protein